MSAIAVGNTDNKCIISEINIFGVISFKKWSVYIYDILTRLLSLVFANTYLKMYLQMFLHIVVYTISIMYQPLIPMGVPMGIHITPDYKLVCPVLPDCTRILALGACV